MRAKRLYDSRADGDIGNKMPVHNIDMDPVASRRINRAHFFAQPCKIGGQDGWRNADGVGHAKRLYAALQASKAAAGVMHRLSQYAHLAPIDKQVANDIMGFCKFGKTKLARDIMRCGISGINNATNFAQSLAVRPL